MRLDPRVLIFTSAQNSIFVSKYFFLSLDVPFRARISFVHFYDALYCACSFRLISQDPSRQGVLLEVLGRETKM